MTTSSSECFQEFARSKNRTPEQVLNGKNILNLSYNNALKKLSAIKNCFDTLLLKPKNTTKFKKLQFYYTSKKSKITSFFSQKNI